PEMKKGRGFPRPRTIMLQLAVAEPPQSTDSEGDTPVIQRAAVALGHVLHAQGPGALERFGGQVGAVGRDDVGGAVAAAGRLEVVDAAIGSDQVDLQVAAVGVRNVHTYRRVGWRVAAAAGDGDGAV